MCGKILSREQLVSEVAEAIDERFDAGGMHYVLDFDTQRVELWDDGSISGESTADELDGHDTVCIDPVSPHEGFEIMRDFAAGVDDAGKREMLAFALEVRHPFSAFRRALERTGLLDAWYDFENKALERIASEWLAAEHVDFVDGKVVRADAPSATYGRQET